MGCKLSISLLGVALLSQVIFAQNKVVAPIGPPPRFITVKGVDQAKGEAIFDVQVVSQNVFDQPTLLVYPDGDQRLTLGTKPNYVHLGEGFKVTLKNAKWNGADGKQITAEAATKRLKPGVTVLLSADGAAVDRAYLGMFKEDMLVVIVAAEELPVPYIPHSTGGYAVKRVGTSADGKQIKKLIHDLGSDEFGVREKASQSLSEMGQPALPALREALGSTDAEVRQRARRIMEAIQTSTKYLSEALKDQDPAQRKEAAEILERLGPTAKAVASALVEVLKDKDETVREAVINALIAIDPTAEAVTRAIPAKAHVNGKYQKLLRRIRVPRDKETYSEFSDYGHFDGNEWAGFTDLPLGYWVYVYPHWYIWEKQKAK